MIKKSDKKLALSTQTIRSLDHVDLERAAGGFTDKVTFTCPTFYSWGYDCKQEPKR